MKRLQLANRYFHFNLVLSAFLLFCSIQTVFALPVSPAAVAQITTGIDESSRVRLTNSTHPSVRSGRAMDMGAVANDFDLPHMFLQLKRSPERERAVEQFVDELHTQGSAHYHQWLTAEQFGALYGPAPQDIARVTGWLKSHGFTVDGVYPSGMVIDFSGTAAQVQQAFGTQIHHYNLDGKVHVSNATDPTLPAALVGVVTGVVSLNDFFARPMLHKSVPGIPPQGSDNSTPDFTYQNSIYKHYNLAPIDFNTIYNVTPLWSSGIRGAGQLIAVIERDTNINSNDWTTFRHAFGLDGHVVTFNQIHPPLLGGYSCTDPWAPSDMAPADGSDSDIETEAALDAEWAGVAAPDANIELVSCKSTMTTDGTDIAEVNLINNSVSSIVPTIISDSWGECESDLGVSGNSFANNTWMQAVAEGITVSVASGDNAAAGCDDNNTVQYASSGLAVATGEASTPYNVALGGTDFADTANGTLSTYWTGGITSVTLGDPVTDTQGQALSYIPEIPWNDSCASSTVLNFINANGGSNYPFTATTTPSMAPGTPYPDATSLCNSPTALPLTVMGASPIGPTQDPLGGLLTIGGGNGGKSIIYPKPSWQTSVYGDPAATGDGARDVPDIALFASPGFWSHAYLICMSDPRPPDVSIGGPHTSVWTAPCTYVNNPDTSSPTANNVSYNGVGGTSASAPAFAGIMALVNQASGDKQGNVNYLLYQLAAAEYGSPSALNASIHAPSLVTCGSGSSFTGITSECIFHDIITGGINVPCVAGKYNITPASPDCYAPTTITMNAMNTNCHGSPCGVLATNVAQIPDCIICDGSELTDGATTPIIAYQATNGYDYATGLGSVNVTNLVNAFKSSALRLTGYYDADRGAPLIGAVGNVLPLLSVSVVNQFAQVNSNMSSGSITVGISGVTLHGTTTQPIIHGTATFNDLMIDPMAGTGMYTLSFSSSTGTPYYTPTTAMATINATGPASYLAFDTPPTAPTSAGSSLGNLAVGVHDADSWVVYTDSSSVVNVLMNGPPTITCSMGMTANVSETVSNGIMAFSVPQRFYTLGAVQLTASVLSGPASGVAARSTTFHVVTGSDLIFADGLESCRW